MEASNSPQTVYGALGAMTLAETRTAPLVETLPADRFLHALLHVARYHAPGIEARLSSSGDAIDLSLRMPDGSDPSPELLAKIGERIQPFAPMPPRSLVAIPASAKPAVWISAQPS